MFLYDLGIVKHFLSVKNEHKHKLNGTVDFLCKYAMKVMTSFGYEIMLPRGFWFQTLDVNKPWRQIPADRLLFFLVFTHFLFLITPRQYEEEKFRLNQTMLLKDILRLPIAE